MNGSLTGDETASRFVTNLDAIDAALAGAGPSIHGVYAHGVHELALG